MKSFKDLISKLKKSQKNDLKPLIEELEEKVSHFNEEIFNAEEIKRRNQEKIQKKQPRKKAETMTNSRRSKKKKNSSMNIVEEEDEMEIEEPVETIARTRTHRNRRNRVVQESQ